MLLQCCIGGRASLTSDLTLVRRQLTGRSRETSQKPLHLLDKREQWWTRGGEERISVLDVLDAS